MIAQILCMADLTWREARRRKIVWAGLGLGSAFIALFCLGLYFVIRDMQRYLGARDMFLDTGFNFMVMSGFYVINFLGVMLAVLASVGAVAGEIGAHTIQPLVAKPWPRATLILGKWLGLAGMVASYIVFLCAGITLGVYLLCGYVPPHVVAGVALMVVQAQVMLALCILGGTRLSTVTNGVVCFMLYGLAFVGSWMEQIGSVAGNETVVDIGIVSSLLVPSEAMWRMAAFRMQPAVITSMAVTPFAVGTSPSTAMLIYALLYTAACLALAVLSFARRDL
ncbi:MAG: ABC transporter permease [Chloroflexota bacterium]